MAIAERISGLTDKELDVLNANVRRLLKRGAVQQRMDAEHLADAESQERKTRKRKSKKAKKAQRH